MNISNIFKETYKYLNSYRKIAKVNIKMPDYQTVDREDFNKIINELITAYKGLSSATEEVTTLSPLLLIGA